MQFRTEFKSHEESEKIKIGQRLITIGSCFADHIGDKLHRYKFSVLNNPFGLLYNPASIERLLQTLAATPCDYSPFLLQRDELWCSWLHHGEFCHPQRGLLLENLNRLQRRVFAWLSKADWLLITFGSAWVWRLRDDHSIVANCHKQPESVFEHTLLSVQETAACLRRIIETAHKLNPALRLVFTVSPIRYLKEGFAGNMRSKANLISALHETISDQEYCYYFPAYEIMMDDLRDYRFYESNLTSPNAQAVEYIWQKFSEIFIDKEAAARFPEIDRLHRALQHKPFFPSSQAWARTLEQTTELLNNLQNVLSEADWQEEINQLNSLQNRPTA